MSGSVNIKLMALYFSHVISMRTEIDFLSQMI